jgi:hypothetical protein
VAPIRAIGLISYSLYLWHWPIDLVVDNQRTGLTGAALLGFRTLLAFAFATASYFLIERPARRLRTSAGARHRLAAATAVIAVVLVGSMVASTTDAPAEQPTSPKALTLKGPANPVVAGAPRIFIAGDSQMFSLGWWGASVFQAETQANFLGGGELGCGVLPTSGKGCTQRDHDWDEAMDHFDPDLTVLWIGAWEAIDFKVGNHTYRHGTQAAEQQIELGLEAAVREFTARGGRVALLEVPCFDTTAGSSDNFGSRNDAHAVDVVNQAQRAVAARMPKLVTYIPWSQLCHNDKPVAKINGVVMRPDGVHVDSEAAAGILLHQLLPVWVGLGRSAQEARGTSRTDNTEAGP